MIIIIIIIITIIMIIIILIIIIKVIIIIMIIIIMLSVAAIIEDSISGTYKSCPVADPELSVMRTKKEIPVPRRCPLLSQPLSANFTRTAMHMVETEMKMGIEMEMEMGGRWVFTGVRVRVRGGIRFGVPHTQYTATTILIIIIMITITII